MKAAMEMDCDGMPQALLVTEALQVVVLVSVSVTVSVTVAVTVSVDWLSARTASTICTLYLQVLPMQCVIITIILVTSLVLLIALLMVMLLLVVMALIVLVIAYEHHCTPECGQI